MAVDVETYNSLPRPKLSPSGAVPNHWHFSIRHVPLEPPGDLLFILNPGSRYIHVEGPVPVLSSQPLAVQANIIAPLLVKAFVSGMGAPSSTPRSAPYTWSTTNMELARAVSRKLSELGVKEEITKIGTGEPEEEKVATEEWERFMEQLKSLHLR